VLIGFALNFFFEANLGWSSRRSMLTSVAIGIVIALVVQRALRRPAE